jgi:hypothetical protein
MGKGIIVTWLIIFGGGGSAKFTVPLLCKRLLHAFILPPCKARVFNFSVFTQFRKSPAKVYIFYLTLFKSVARKPFLGKKNIGGVFAFPLAPPPQFCFWVRNLVYVGINTALCRK